MQQGLKARAPGCQGERRERTAPSWKGRTGLWGRKPREGLVRREDSLEPQSKLHQQKVQRRSGRRACGLVFDSNGAERSTAPFCVLKVSTRNSLTYVYGPSSVDGQLCCLWGTKDFSLVRINTDRWVKMSETLIYERTALPQLSRKIQGQSLRGFGIHKK